MERAKETSPQPDVSTRLGGLILHRHPGDILRLVLGGLIVFVSALAIHRDSISTLETNVFRVINDFPLPTFLHPLVWLIMQLGVIGAVPATVAAALLARRWRLALDFGVAGGAIYFIAKLVKDLIVRGRPQTLLDDVHILGEPALGLGYVSGHSAVAVALATVAAPYLGRRARRVAWVLAVLVCVFRVYVGAHLPLDVIGGAALGWAAGAIAHLALGAPDGRIPVARVREALQGYGITATDLHPIEEATRRSASFHCRTDRGEELFVKVISRGRRDDDFIYRMWRLLTHREVVRRGRFGSPLRLVEHEALMCSLAANAGVSAPQVVVAGSFGNGTGLFVTRWISGSDLSQVGDPSLVKAKLVEIWQQVATLHRARIAHGDLRAESIVLGEDGHPRLVDLARAHVAADDHDLAQDVADTLECLSRLSDHAAAADAMHRVLSEVELERVAPLPRARNLSPAVSSADGQGSVEELAQGDGTLPDQTEVAPASHKRRSKPITKIVQLVISAAIIIGVFVFFLPTIADYSAVWATITDLTWIEFATLFGVMLLNILTYWTQMQAFMPGLTLAQAAVNNQTSTSVANTLPGGGAIAIGVSYAMFRSWGFRDSDIVLFTLDTGIWNSFLKLALPIVAFSLLALTGGGSAALLVPALIGLAALIGAITCFALILWKKRFARAIGSRLGAVVSWLRKLIRKPPVEAWGEAAVRFRKQTNTLVSRRWAAMTLTTLVSHLGLYLVLLVTLRHVGVSEQEVGWAEVLGVFALARLATAIPLTPGGLGVVEATQIAGLVLAGGNRAQVVAAVLVFRALTYGLQIPLGALTYLIWQRNTSWRKVPPHEGVAQPATVRQPVA